ncbi:MAG: glycosyltransferase family 4 protein [Verrucomicrobiota bacterium]
MRVVHVITRLVVGGAQENTVASVLGLRQVHGFDVQLVSGPSRGPEGSLEPLLKCAGFPVDIEPALVRPIHPWKDVFAWSRLTRRFRQSRPDLVHTHSGKAGFLGRLAAARAGVPIIVHTIHGPSFGPFQGAAANRVFLTAERRAARVTTHFVSVAHAMTRQYLQAGIGRPGQYTRVLSGFDVTPFLNPPSREAIRSRAGFAASDLVVGTVARLFKLKGHDDLIDAAPALLARCPSLRFLFVGDGAWRARLEQRVRNLGLRDRFHFAGLVDPADIPAWIGAMDILVHLSRREGLPRALPQALASAKPIVACNADGAAEVCLDGTTGFLVPPGDREALTSKLLRLAGDPALRQQFGNTGRELVRNDFNLDVMIRELGALYRRLAAEKGVAVQ